jgi:hydroxylaminobenzene mutase
MDTSALLARQAHRLIQVGISLLLFAALVGLAVPHFTVPRLALSAHLIGILQGIFFVAVGQVWPRLTLSMEMSKVTFWLLIYGGIAALTANLFAAAWGAGNLILPMAAGSAHGSLFQEAVINISLRSAAASLIAALVLILWGLRLGVVNPPKR